MNQKTLEMVYLMNVLQYFINYHDLINYLHCCRKCYESIKATRINPILKWNCDDKSTIIPKGRFIGSKTILFKQILLFRNLETIETDGKFVEEIIQKESLKKYYFHIHNCKCNDFLKIPIDRIRILDVIIKKDDAIDLRTLKAQKVFIYFIDVKKDQMFHLLNSIPKHTPVIVITSNIMIKNCVSLFPYSKFTLKYKQNNFVDNEIIIETSIPLLKCSETKDISLFLPKNVNIESNNEYCESMYYAPTIYCEKIDSPKRFTPFLKELTVKTISTDLGYIKKIEILDVEKISSNVSFPQIIDCLILNNYPISFQNITNILSLKLDKLYLDHINFTYSFLPPSVVELHLIKSKIPNFIDLLPNLKYISLFECTTNKMILPSTLERFETENLQFEQQPEIFIDESQKLTKLLIYNSNIYALNNPSIVKSLEIGNMTDFCLNSFISLKDLIIVSCSVQELYIAPSLTRLEFEYCTFLNPLDFSKSKIKDIYIGYCYLNDLQLPTTLHNSYFRRNCGCSLRFGASEIENCYCEEIKNVI